MQHESMSKDNILKQQKNELSRLKVDEETLSNILSGCKNNRFFQY